MQITSNAADKVAGMKSATENLRVYISGGGCSGFSYGFAFDENLKNYGGEDTELALRIYNKFPGGLRFDKNLICYHHDQKNLAEFCNNMENYGKFNLPYIISKHPDFKSDFVPNWALSGIGGYLLFNPLVSIFIKLLLLFFTAKYLIRYQVIVSVIKGYRFKKNIN